MKPKLRKRKKAKPMSKKNTKKSPVAVDRKSAAAGDTKKSGFRIEGSPVVPLVAPARKAIDAKPPATPQVSKPLENRRITAGAEIKEWRIARSLREKQPGYFLQGGHFKRTSRGNSFIVGEEHHFKTHEEAKKALAAKKPAAPPTAPIPVAPDKPPVAPPAPASQTRTTGAAR
jgi:hypothetical protein